MLAGFNADGKHEAVFIYNIMYSNV
jgi:hypothetical protein